MTGNSLARESACGHPLARAGACSNLPVHAREHPPWHMEARGHSSMAHVGACDVLWALTVRAARGSTPSTCQQQISRSDDQVASEGVSKLRFRCVLVLEFHLEKRNTLVQSEICFEHFLGHPNFVLGS